MADLVRSKIKALIESVPDTGIVHQYERWTADWGKFITLFKATSGEILGWEISRSAAPGIYLNTVEEQINHRYLIRGYMGLQDATETELSFNEKIEAIRDAFRSDMTLGGMNELPVGFDCRLIEPRSFGSVLCHYAEIIIEVQEVQ
jgi:hypothetical protein